MQGLTSCRFDYCHFGYDYQKPTRIWTSRTDLEDHVCACPTKSHKHNIGITSPYKLSRNGQPDPSKTVDRYSVPEALLRHMFSKHLP